MQAVGVGTMKPLDREGPDPTLLILDGLDELSKAGQVGERVIQSFVSEVTALQASRNMRDRAQLLVLLCGRPVAVDTIKASVRSEEGVINLLPYRADRDDLARPAGDRRVQLGGQVDLLEEDQRKRWWMKYYLARGRDHGEDVYEQLQARKELTSLTAQPLLNYLVALLAPPSGDLSGLPGNLCDLYGQLLREIWERGWEKRQQVPALKEVRFEEFEELLQVIALTAWHAGSQRSIRSALVEQKCAPEQLDLLGRLGQDGPGGVLRLLLGFFFRPLGRDEGERTYEFTHKSFAEYLLARRLGRTVAELTEDWKQGKAGRLWADEQALIRWAEVFGPVQFGEEVWEFVRLELKALGEEVARARQALSAHLLGVVIRDGMPMHAMTARLGASATFKEMARQALNCEHGLLMALSGCFGVTRQASRIPGLAGQLPPWLNARWRTFGPLWFTVGSFDLSNENLDGAYLTGAYLTGAYLTGASLTGANLTGANLTGARLDGANLARASLVRANLVEASLTGAKLDWANLDGARLDGARLDGANLARASLVRADVRLEQLRTTLGDPLVMPDGKPPKKNWRAAKPRSPRKKKADPPTQ
jgi:hypothetical protein